MSTPRFTLCLVLILALLAPGAAQSLAQRAASPAAPASPTAPGSMLIIENAGQWPAAARFQVWNSPLGPGTTWLAEDAIWLVVAGGKLQVVGSEGFAGPLADLPPATLQPATLHALKLTFPGSNPDVRIESFDPLTTTVSYFIGNDPEQWRPAVPVWGGVRYVDLYPGVDLVLGGPDSGWRLEAESGAATELVRVQIEGADVVAIDGGVLRLTAAGQPLSVRLPEASFPYQVVGQSPESMHRLMAHPVMVAAQLAQPDDNPSDLLYSTFLGGSGVEEGRGVAVDGEGRAYVIGWTESSDFPTTPGAFDPSYNGTDAFVVRLNADGSTLNYATFLGGSMGGELGYAIAVDGAGRAYVTGLTESSDFPTTPGVFDPSHNGSFDAFVVRLNADGSALDYATFLGGSSSETGYAIAADGEGRAYVTGDTSSYDFPTTPGAFDPSHNGFEDAFVARLNADGSTLDYATYLGGNNWDAGLGIAVDGEGRAYVTGTTGSSNFPTTPGAFDPSYNGADAFVARLDADGSALDYATFLGGSSWASGHSIAVDGEGCAYVTGVTGSSDFPTTPGAFDPSYNGADDAFVVKLNPAGSALHYATFLGGSNEDQGHGIGVDGEGRAYVTGTTKSSDFPSTPGAFDPSFDGYSDSFVAKLNATGSALDYATFLGGSSSEEGLGIAVDEQGYAYVAGDTWSSDFPTTPAAFDPTYNGGELDAFVVKLDTNGQRIWFPVVLRSR